MKAHVQLGEVDGHMHWWCEDCHVIAKGDGEHGKKKPALEHKADCGKAAHAEPMPTVLTD